MKASMRRRHLIPALAIILCVFTGEADEEMNSEAGVSRFLIAGSAAAEGGAGHGSATVGGSAGHDEHHMVAKFDVILLFSGGILVFSLLYCMTSDRFNDHCVHGMAAYTWKWVSLVMSLFLAILMWADFYVLLNKVRSDMEKEHSSETKLALVAFLMTIGYTSFVLLLYVIIVASMHRCVCCVNAIEAFVSIWAHVTGFALLHIVSYAEDLLAAAMASHGPAWLWAGIVWILFVVAIPLFLFFIQLMLKNCCVVNYFEDDKEQEKEIISKLRKFTAESSGLSLAWNFLRVFIAMIAPELPEFMDTKIEPKALHQKLVLLAMTIVFTVIAAVVHTVLVRKSERIALRMMRKFLLSFTNFLAAFGWFEVIRWTVYDISFVRDGEDHVVTSNSLFLHIMMALLVTFVGLALVPLLARLQCGVTGLGEGIGDVVFIFAMLAAFSWAMCIDILMFASLSKDNTLYGGIDNPDTYFCMALFLALLPMYLFAVFPKTKDMTEKHLAHQALEQEDEFEDEDEEYDDDEE